MKELTARLARATIEVGAFVADKKNSEQGYSYISADAVLDRAGIALSKNGVAVIPSIESIETTLVERPSKNPRIDTRVNFRMLVTDGESDFVSTWYGMGSDYSTPDKSLYKAITSGHKYFLMKLLNISVGNTDSEHDDEPGQSKPQDHPAQTQPDAGKKQPKDEPAPAKGRPMAPEALKAALVKKAGSLQGVKVVQADRWELVKRLEAVSGKDTRREVTKYLTGYDSTNNMPDNVVKALLDWAADAESAKAESVQILAVLAPLKVTPEAEATAPDEKAAKLIKELGF